MLRSVIHLRPTADTVSVSDSGFIDISFSKTEPRAVRCSRAQGNPLAMLYWCGFAVARRSSEAGVCHLPRVKIAGRSQSLDLMAVNEEVRGRGTPCSKERGSVEASKGQAPPGDLA